MEPRDGARRMAAGVDPRIVGRLLRADEPARVRPAGRPGQPGAQRAATGCAGFPVGRHRERPVSPRRAAHRARRHAGTAAGGRAGQRRRAPVGPLRHRLLVVARRPAGARAAPHGEAAAGRADGDRRARRRGLVRHRGRAAARGRRPSDRQLVLEPGDDGRATGASSGDGPPGQRHAGARRRAVGGLRRRHLPLASRRAQAMGCAQRRCAPAMACAARGQRRQRLGALHAGDAAAARGRRSLRRPHRAQRPRRPDASLSAGRGRRAPHPDRVAAGRAALAGPAVAVLRQAAGPARRRSRPRAAERPRRRALARAARHGAAAMAWLRPLGELDRCGRPAQQRGLGDAARRRRARLAACRHGTRPGGVRRGAGRVPPRAAAACRRPLRAGPRWPGRPVGGHRCRDLPPRPRRTRAAGPARDARRDRGRLPLGAGLEGRRALGHHRRQAASLARGGPRPGAGGARPSRQRAGALLRRLRDARRHAVARRGSWAVPTQGGPMAPVARDRGRRDLRRLWRGRRRGRGRRGGSGLAGADAGGGEALAGKPGRPRPQGADDRVPADRQPGLALARHRRRAGGARRDALEAAGPFAGAGLERHLGPRAVRGRRPVDVDRHQPRLVAPDRSFPGLRDDLAAPGADVGDARRRPGTDAGRRDAGLVAGPDPSAGRAPAVQRPPGACRVPPGRTRRGLDRGHDARHRPGGPRARGDPGRGAARGSRDRSVFRDDELRLHAAAALVATGLGDGAGAGRAAGVVAGLAPVAAPSMAEPAGPARTAGGRAHARAGSLPRAARGTGQPRCADRALEPARLDGDPPARGRAGAPRAHAADARDRRHRPLQAGQRHPRPSGRGCGAEGLRRPPRRDGAAL